MLKFILWIGFIFVSSENFAQEESTAQRFRITQPDEVRCGSVESASYIDSALFANYLNWHLQTDSLPVQARSGLDMLLEISYIISREGKITDVHFISPADAALQEHIVNTFRRCPLQWSPAYRNGRAIKDYKKFQLYFPGNGNKPMPGHD